MPRREQSGFSYLLLLWLVAIAGVTLTALGQSWMMDARREREAELTFRGEQIRQAIDTYAKVPVREGMSPFPVRLADLLHDTRGGRPLHHLRQPWGDPMTGDGEWGLIKDKGGITGVYSLSSRTPVRPPPGVRSYAEWRFVASAAPSSSAASTPAGSAMAATAQKSSLDAK